MLLAGFAAPLHAETDSGDEIVVTGLGLSVPPGTPAYGSVVIDRDRLTGNATGRVEDVLEDVAGFQQFRRSDSRSANPSAQGATLRALGGNASSRALVLLDGVPMADPFFGYIPFNAVTPERLSAIRVTRGGGAGAFGAGAVAGTIELSSATRADLPVYAASLYGGSRDSQEASASFSPDIGNGYVSISGRWERGDGFMTTPASQRVAASVPSRYRDWSAGITAVAPIDAQTEIQARALVYRDNRTLRFAGADSSSEGQDASIRLVHRGDWAVDALAYVQARNFSNIVISSTSFRKTLDQRNTPATGIGGKIELRPPVDDAHVLRIGLDARHAAGDMYEDPYNATTGLVTARRHAGGNQLTAGAFIEDDWTLGRLVLTGGGRIDRWTIDDGFFTETTPAGAISRNDRFADRSGWKGSGRVGALYNAGAAVSLRAAGYTGFRLPTLNELYRSFSVFPVVTRANEALGLEKLKGIEGGIDLTPAPWLRLSGTLFYNRLEGAISNITIATNTKQRQNVDAIVAKGVELTADARLGAFRLTASYAWDKSRVHASGAQAGIDGFTPSQSPRHAASTTLAWAPSAGPALSATLRYVGKQYEDDLMSDVLPSAFTADAAASLPITTNLRIVARAENIFNKNVITRNQAGSIDLGTPQTFWLGLKIQG
ncbi:TonB-dependent receptor, partial [uncultured Sphingomonas sp.]|uniref:TonB-dependent receptor n=1 Tax=uncultured Sphingomonas sp. TaxID=158754 RepID=UPI0026270334